MQPLSFPPCSLRESGRGDVLYLFPRHTLKIFIKPRDTRMESLGRDNADQAAAHCIYAEICNNVISNNVSYFRFYRIYTYIYRIALRHS